jgi:hypothetical protein
MIEEKSTSHPCDRFSTRQTEREIIFQFIYGFVGGEK